MNLWKDLSTYDEDSNGAKATTLRVIIEIPKGSLLKYELDPTGSYMTIVRAMDRKYPYEYNYGCIPQTLGGDNDPLDAIVIYKEPIYPGTVLNCNILGVVTTTDNGKEDDKIICVPYFDLPVDLDLRRIINYLNNYKYPYQKGTFVKKVYGKVVAEKIIEKAMKRFQEENKE